MSEIPTSRQGAEVIAALDASAHDDAVVGWAALEAERLGAALRLVSVVDAGLQLTPYEALAAGSPNLAEQVDQDTRKHLDEVAGMVREANPGLSVVTDVPWGSPATGLVRATEGARLLVMGSPGHGGLASVVVPVMAHADCPVVVVPEGTTAARPRHVVVGVDSSDHSLRTLEAALDVVDPDGGSVTCVVAWRTEIEAGMLITWPVADPVPEIDERYDDLLSRTIERVAPGHPDVTVRKEVRHGHSAPVILDVAHEVGADLVAVGSRGHGGFTGLLLGSVSRRVVAKADLPVMVVH